MIKSTRLLMLMLAIVLGPFIQAIPPANAQGYFSPRLMLMNYFNAINRRNYPLAYAYWISPPWSEYGFEQGFEDTHHIIPYLGDAQISVKASRPVVARVPAVMLAYSVGRRLSAFYGCFTLAQRGGWRIEGATLTEIPDQMLPDRNSILAFLGQDCTSAVSDMEFSVRPRRYGDVQDLINGYYDSINAKEYEWAYDAWLMPDAPYGYHRAKTPDYRPPYDAYVASFASTMYADVYFGRYFYTGARTGKRYLDGLQPVVVVDQHYDGSFASYYGCFVIGSSVYDYLGIVNVKLFPLPLDLPGDIPDARTILRYADTYCPGLPIAW
jgi:hypothetical protein